MKHRSVIKKKLVRTAVDIAHSHPDEARFLRKLAETRKVIFNAEAGTMSVPNEHLGKSDTLLSMKTERLVELLHAYAPTSIDLLFFLRRSHIDVTLVHKERSTIQLQGIMNAVNYLVFSPI